MSHLGPWKLEQDGPLAVLTIDKPPLNLARGLMEAPRVLGLRRTQAELQGTISQHRAGLPRRRAIT